MFTIIGASLKSNALDYHRFFYPHDKNVPKNAKQDKYRRKK